MSDAPALYMLTADGEGGAEVYSAARTRDRPKSRSGPPRKWPAGRGTFALARGRGAGPPHRTGPVGELLRAVSADADSLEGKNVHFGLIDEFMRTAAVTSTTRSKPAPASATKSIAVGHHDRGLGHLGVCYEQQAYVRNILKGDHQGRELFRHIIFTIDEGGRLDGRSDLAQGQPELRRFGRAEHLALQLSGKAMQSPASQASFLTKHLDVWIQTDQALFDMTAGGVARSIAHSRSVRGRGMSHCGRPRHQD